MKKALALLLVLVLMSVSCTVFAEGSLLGGWQLYENETASLPEEAAAAAQKAFEGIVGCTYRPIALLATQVVAGTNYCFLCELTAVVPDAVPSYALVYVYQDLNGDASILHVFEIDIAAGMEELPDVG